MRVTVTVLDTNDSYELELGESLLIGRADDCDVTLDSSNVSRKHCKLELREDGLIIADLDSSYGTTIGDKKIKKVRIKKRRTFQVADVGVEVAFENMEALKPRKSTRSLNEGIESKSISPKIKKSVSKVKGSTLNSKGKEEVFYDGSIMGAVNLTMKTMPFIITRLGILFGFTLLTIGWFLFCTFIMSVLFKGTKSDVVGYVYLFMLIFPLGFFAFLRKYILYMLKAAHIACLTELMTKGTLPEEGMVEYGKNIVKEEFPQINIMFVIDKIIKGVVNVLNSTLDFITGLIPIPGLDSLMGFVKAIIRMSTTYIDETILSYNFSNRGENVWASSRDGLIYYAQNSKPILTVAVKAVALDYVLSGILTFITLIVAGLITQIHSSIAGWTWVLALLLMFNIRAVVIRPICLIMVMGTFHKCIIGQAPDPEWQDRLSGMSSKFKDLTKNALPKAVSST